MVNNNLSDGNNNLSDDFEESLRFLSWMIILFTEVFQTPEVKAIAKRLILYICKSLIGGDPD